MDQSLPPSEASSANAPPPPDEAAERLRDFSAQIAARLRAAPAASNASMRLAVRIGPDAYLIEMAVAGEVVALGEVAPVPWTKPWYRGLTNVRGRLVGVIDLIHFGGGAPLSADQGRQLLVIGDALQSNSALIITRAFGLRNLKDLERLDTIDDGARPWEIARYRDSDGSVLTELDLQRLVSFERFGAIGR